MAKNIKDYDVLVIGAGVALNVVFKAVEAGLKVALVNKDDLGGTCLNVGCVPSKILIYPADRIREVEEAGRIGVKAQVNEVNFASIMARMNKARNHGRFFLREEIEKNSKNLDYYHAPAHFTGPYTLELEGQFEGQLIRGKKVFIASGSRPMIPPIKGLGETGYLTNESVLELQKPPESMIIIGGGYIAVEYAHFFSAAGSRVTIIEALDSLISQEEPEIVSVFETELSRYAGINKGLKVVEAGREGTGVFVTAQDKNGGKRKFTAESTMVAVGRVSNADLIRAAAAGIQTDDRNYIRVDDGLLTNVENIWAFGDATGRQMFTHAGDREAEIAWHNATHDETKKMGMDFDSVPHAIFSHPQIAGVGLTEKEARRRYGDDVLVGRASYSDVAKGIAMQEKVGFAKAIARKKDRKLLGFHILGPLAPILIQEVANTIANGGSADYITGSMHIFPELSELIPEALGRLA
ncbi:MAG: dihydrolipoyl dehydrogenase [Nitrospiraceae bacterium]|nr:dihydrolipoyl dehydrogenase [Nitrospiraceae bacterium]